MKRLLPMLLLAAGAAMSGAGATVLFLEPLGLAMGGSTEDEVRGRLGTPQRRSVAPDGQVALRFAPRDPSLRAVEVQLAPDNDGTPRVDQVALAYRTARNAAALRSRYRLGEPRWEARESFDGLACRVEYHDKAKVSHFQGAFLALAFCNEHPDAAGKDVSILKYLSQRAFRELAHRHGLTINEPDAILGMPPE